MVQGGDPHPGSVEAVEGLQVTPQDAGILEAQDDGDPPRAVDAIDIVGGARLLDAAAA